MVTVELKRKLTLLCDMRS